MRILFMGTPAFAVPALDAILAAGHEVAAVWSQPPRPAGRGKAPRPGPVHSRAEALGLTVHTPLTLRDPAAQAEVAGYAADVAVVAAYGLLLPAEVLAAPAHGCLNIHASLLPRWRGAAPIQRAILAGDAETGVTIMQMERGLDTGPMLADARTAIARYDAGTLTEALASLGAALVVRVLADLAAFPPVPQPEGATHAPKIDKAEARLDFSLPAEAVERAVRAFNPAPGAFVLLGEERLRILAADIVAGDGAPGTVLDDRLTIACGTGAIRPTLVQRAGRAAMPADALLRGLPIPPGTRL
ncbi:MAG: methionyl-tRNA formyltransferase [Sphingomonas fennica]